VYKHSFLFNHLDAVHILDSVSNQFDRRFGERTLWHGYNDCVNGQLQLSGDIVDLVDIDERSKITNIGKDVQIIDLKVILFVLKCAQKCVSKFILAPVQQVGAVVSARKQFTTEYATRLDRK
jgi:hypothetical protein